ncbi:MAG: rhomboid family intramembrane serine protease [Pirellulales bacterium]
MLFPLYDYNPHSRFPMFTIVLIAANVFVMFRMSAMNMQGQLETVLQYGFIPARLTQVDQPQPIMIREQAVDPMGNPIPGRAIVAKLSTDGRDVYPTMLTMMFVHGGWLHLLSNMWMLWVFGNNVEDRLGRLVYPMFYILGGIIAVLAQWAVDPHSTVPVVGASGAVAAVLGGYLITYPAAQVRTLLFIGIPLLINLPAFLVLGAWFLMQTAAALNLLPLGLGAGPEVKVAFWAHIGGFLAGLILMPILGIGSSPPGKSWYDEARELFDFPSGNRDEPRSRS